MGVGIGRSSITGEYWHWNNIASIVLVKEAEEVAVWPGSNDVPPWVEIPKLRSLGWANT